MLSMFSCACWPSLCFLWGNVLLDFLTSFFLIGLFGFFDINVYWVVFVIVEINSLVALFANIFSHSVLCLFFLFVFLCRAKAFKFNQVPFVYFYFHYPTRQIQKIIAVIYVIESSANAFLHVRQCLVLPLDL